MRVRNWALAGLLLAGLNCVALMDGEHPYREGDTTIKGKACLTDINCNDDNPCTTETCPADTFVCEYLAQPDGLPPDTAQTPADCKRVQCIAGKPVTQDDPQDFFNDQNGCTEDACVGGASTNTMKPEGAPCMQGDKSGTCVANECKISCATNIDCDDGNPCSEDLCNTSESKCVFTLLDSVPTPGVMQTAGDCRVHLCQNGTGSEVNDDADVLVDSNPCTLDVCVAGKPSNPPVIAQTPCILGEVKVCDGMGACVDCLEANDCVTIAETECEKRSCVSNKCQIAYQGPETLASPVLQTAKDCKKVVCNGNMGTMTVEDNADLPDDGNACTTDTCSNGTPMIVNKPAGTTCGANGVCSMVGVCVGCNTPNDCMGTDEFCKARTCTNNVCGIGFTPNGTDLPTADQISGDCKIRECDGMGNIKTSVLTSDVPVDGNTCTQDLCSMAGAPSNPPTALNSPCNVNGGTLCDGNGTCKKDNGRMCTAAAECLDAYCADGVCCDKSCQGTCYACNLAGDLGFCNTLPRYTDDTNATTPCTGTNTCDGNGSCKLKNGEACALNAVCASGKCTGGLCQP